MKAKRKPNGYWTLEKCKEDSLKYISKSEWQNNVRSGYSAAQKNGWLEECCKHMLPKQKPSGYWTLEVCKFDALKYNSKSEWRNNSSNGYETSVHNKWLEECCKHMVRPAKKIKWTLEACKEEALRFKTKIEWQKNSRSCYVMAYRNNWLEECCKHMIELKKLNGYWNLKRCIESALRFNSKMEWENSGNSGYSAARKNGWLEKCCKHMKNEGGSSKQERELFSVIKEKYPDAIKKRFKSNPKEFFQSSFELDIYIPSLNKGVEFNGTYWHGEGFKRDWTSDPIQYHKVKKEFFKQENIQYLEIKESHWLKSPEKCIKKVLKFLAKSAA